MSSGKYTKIILNVPHYDQERDNSCLPACVRMVLAYWGIAKPEHSIRILLKTRPAGTNPININNLIDWDIKSRLSSSNLDELLDYIFLERPIIVLLWTGVLSYWDSNK